MASAAEGLRETLDRKQGWLRGVGRTAFDRIGQDDPGEVRRFLLEEATAAPAGAEIEQRRQLTPATLAYEAAAVGEDAALDRLGSGRREARYRVEPAQAPVEAEPRQAAQQADRVGVARLREELTRRRLLDQHAAIEDANPLAHPRDDGEVVPDEQHGGAVLVAQCLDQVQHFGFDGGVEAGRGLVENYEAAVDRQRHGDDHALLHAARQLVRVAPHHPFGIGDLHVAQHGHGPLLRVRLGQAGDLEHFGELSADHDGRIEGAPGVLVDHRQPARAQLSQLGTRQPIEVLAVHQDAPRRDAPVTRQIAHDRKGHGGFAATRFPYQAIGLSVADAQVQIAQHLAVAAAHPIGYVESLDAQRVLLRRRVHSPAPCKASAIRFMATTKEAMASASNRTVHQ